MTRAQWDPRQSGARRTVHSAEDLRASDAERNEVAALLSEHYSDGRLSEEEFNQRLDQAMRAKTRRDLTGLFEDLPRLAEGPAPTPRRRGAPLLLCVVVLALLATWSPMAFWHVPWLLIAAVGFLLLRRSRRHARRPGHLREAA